MNKVVEETYKTLRNPASFTSVEPLYKELRENHPSIKRKDVIKTLRNSDTYTLHRKSLNRFKRLATKSSGLYVSWQMDLIDFQSFAQLNKGYRYAITLLDVYSRQLFSHPLKTKTGREVLEAIKKVFTEDRMPLYVACDQGKEFWNRDVMDFMKQNNIHMYSPTSQEIKCGMIERYNALLHNKLRKAMYQRGKWQWYDLLDDALYSLNHRYCRTIGMRPADVKKDSFGFQYEPPTKCKFRVGDFVRLASYKKVFSKRYNQKWTDERFVIAHAFPRNPPVYHVKDLKDNLLHGLFYEPELQLVENESGLYRIETIIKRRTVRGRKQFFVKYLGYDDPAWVNASDVVDLSE